MDTTTDTTTTDTTTDTTTTFTTCVGQHVIYTATTTDILCGHVLYVSHVRTDML